MAHDPLQKDTKPNPASPALTEQTITDAVEPVTLRQPQPEPDPKPAPAPVSETCPETPPKSIVPTKAETNPYDDLGPRSLGNKSAMYSDPSTNPNRQPVQPVAPDAVPQTAAPDIKDPMEREWAKAVDKQLSKAKQGTAYLKAIHPEIRQWFAARRAGNTKAQAAAALALALALARDRAAYDLIMTIPNSGIIPEGFGRPPEQGTRAQTTPSPSQSKGIDPARAAQYDRGRGIGDD